MAVALAALVLPFLPGGAPWGGKATASTAPAVCSSDGTARRDRECLVCRHGAHGVARLAASQRRRCHRAAGSDARMGSRARTAGTAIPLSQGDRAAGSVRHRAAEQVAGRRSHRGGRLRGRRLALARRHARARRPAPAGDRVAYALAGVARPATAARPGPAAGGTRWRATRPDSDVLLGDLNLTPFAPAFARLLDESRLRDALADEVWRPTWLAGFWPLALPIDHVLVPRGSCVTAQEIGPYVGSDHRPVQVTLQLP